MQKIHAAQVLTPNGWQNNLCINVENGYIKSITKAETHTVNMVDALLPAAPNLHSHSFQRAMSGLTEFRGSGSKDNFWSWRNLMYQFLEYLNPDHILTITELAFMEMLEAGYSSVAEFHYLHHDISGQPYSNIAQMAESIVAAANRTGIGLTLLPVLYMQGGCDKRSLSGAQKRFGCDFDLYEKLYAHSSKIISTSSSDYAIGLAPHSLRAVTPNSIFELEQINPTCPIHMHVAEQIAEVNEVKSYLGARPIEWLLQNTELSKKWCLIHCTQMTSKETSQLAKTGAVVGLCPITEANLGDGIFNGVEYSNESGCFGVGTDSNVNISLFDELASLEYSQRLRDQSRAVLAHSDKSTGRVIFDTAAQSPATITSRPSGTISEGSLADFFAISTDNSVLCNHKGDTLLDCLIFTGRGQSCITDVWSAGRHIVKKGKHIDRERIIREYMICMKELLTKL